MANRDLSIDIAPASPHSGLKESAINIQMEQETPHDAISRGYKKWTIKESYVERRVSRKKQKLLKPIEHLSTPQAHHPILQTPDKNMFFTGVNQTQDKNSMAREQLRNFSIEKSNRFVQIVKSNRKKLLKIRMVTEPSHIKPPLSLHPPKEEEPHQLFNYLRRSFINHKTPNINNTIIETFKTQSPKSIIEKISEKSRRFLLQKMQKDYKNYAQIDNYKQQQIKHLLQQQIQKKKRLFRSDYNKRYSSPYFSFLSLNKEEKANILKRQHLTLQSV